MTDYFISDAHLYPSWKDHPGRASLHCFLDDLAGKDPGGLWILGDLFDYWFEYRDHMPAGYTDTLRLLRDLGEKGWKTRFIPGNHDWWCGEHLRESSGMEIIRRTIHVETIQGHRCLMAHGDGLGTGDTGYRLIRPVLRANLMRALFSTVHPTLGTWLATRFSNTSRRILRTQVDTIPEYLSSWVKQQRQSGVNLVITGHTHCPSLADLGGIEHASLGDWISHFTYLTIRGGEISLNEYEG